jgi:dienelactone hydrolase
MACLFLPKNVSPPFQTVIYFPGSGAFYETSSDQITQGIQFETFLEFIVKDGRAVMYPIYKGTYERGNTEIYPTLHQRMNTFQGAQLWIQMIQDVRRSLDYLEIRPDIKMDKLAFYVYSWGGHAGTIVPAIEDRLAANILCLSGLSGGGRAVINPINYVRRVKIPTLLISGIYDHIFDLETRAKPLFELLGTPIDQKHHVLSDTDHAVQKNVVIRDVLWFLDKYLGPAKSFSDEQ